MWKPGEGWLVAVLVIALLMAAGISVSPSGSEQTTYRLDFVAGSMFISDAGSSHGGFEFAASYIVTLSPAMGAAIYSGDKVNMRLELEAGLGDPLSEHDFMFGITYNPESDEIALTFAKTRFQLVHVLEDMIWSREFDGYYIASWGGFAPPEEIRGMIGPAVFNLPNHCYLELRMDLETVPLS